MMDSGVATYVYQSGCQEGKNDPPLPLLSSCGWTYHKINTKQINGRKRNNLIHAHRGIIEMGPKK